MRTIVLVTSPAMTVPSLFLMSSLGKKREGGGTWNLNTYDVGGGRCICSMSQQLGSEVERQGKVNKSTTALSFQRKEEELPWVGFEPTTLCSLGKRACLGDMLLVDCQSARSGAPSELVPLFYYHQKKFVSKEKNLYIYSEYYPPSSMLTVQLCVYIINGRGTPQYPRLTTDECRYYSRHIEGLRNFDDVIVSDEDGETDAGLVSQNQSDGRKHGSREKTIINSTCTQSIIRFVRTTKTNFF